MNFVVNDNTYRIEKSGLTVLQACVLVGLEIPRFCYHDKLSIAGNCRMCLVEVAAPKAMKPMASCALPLSNNMVIYTNTMLVHKARESVMEFLLANHPLDCPVCDQGGECDLQDQSKIFGNDRGRFYESKRAVEDKNLGPLVKTVMTRCIQCTRCVRFITEVAGVSSLGVVGRGGNMEIGMYVEKLLDSELSGNVIDICPVGALTSKPYSFTARPWELESFESVDVLDTFGSRIKVDVKGREVMRIQPSLQSSLNGDWITDKIRFCYDGLRLQRLIQPMQRKSGFLLNCTWREVFESMSWLFYNNYLQSGFGRFYMVEVRRVCLTICYGSLIDLNMLASLKSMFLSVFCFKTNEYVKFRPRITYQKSFFFEADFFENLTFGFSYKDFGLIDFLLLVNLNPRLQLPLLNLQIRKNIQKNKLIVCSVGYLTDLTYDCFSVGNNLASLVILLRGKHHICRKIVNSKRSVILFGESFFQDLRNYRLFRFFEGVFKSTFRNLNSVRFMFQVLISNVGLLHGMALGLNNFKSLAFLKNRKFWKSRVDRRQKHFCVLFGTDDIDQNFKFLIKDYVAYVGHNGGHNLNFVDVVLPTRNFLEKTSSYLNIEGRVQTSQYVIESPEPILEDWMLFLGLTTFVFKPGVSLYTTEDSIFYSWDDDSPLFCNIRTLTRFFLRGESFLPFDTTLKIFELKETLQVFCQFFLLDAVDDSSSSFYLNADFTHSIDPQVQKISFIAPNQLFATNNKHFFMSDPITKASSILASASLKFVDASVP